jgi:hypothetical protein
VLIYIDLMSSRFRFEDEGEQGPGGPAGAQGATSVGAQGPQGLQGAQGAQGPSSGVLTGAQGSTLATTATPVAYDRQMVTGGTIGVYATPTPIGARPTYLPGGNWEVGVSRNNLPVSCNRFNFLDVSANMVSVGGSDTETVYIPCYWDGRP